MAKLHSAGAERYHTVGKREILAFKHLDISHHLSFAVITGKCSPFEKSRFSQEFLINAFTVTISIDMSGMLAGSISKNLKNGIDLLE
jgi:hypothetical protein